MLPPTFFSMPSLNNHTLTNIPGAVMNAVLLPGKLNVCHGNAQSICARRSTKMEEVSNMLLNSVVSIACFTESWLSPKIADRSIAIPGFKIARNDRLYMRGGGIVIYYKEHLRCHKVFETVLQRDSEDKTECLALVFHFGTETLLLMAVYNPPDNDCSSPTNCLTSLLITTPFCSLGISTQIYHLGAINEHVSKQYFRALL